MRQHRSILVDGEAARAMVDWKAFLAAEVSVHAKKLAEGNDALEFITLANYRVAALLAAQSLTLVLCQLWD